MFPLSCCGSFSSVLTHFDLPHPSLSVLFFVSPSVSLGSQSLRHPSVRRHIERSPALWRLDLADRSTLSRAALSAVCSSCCCCPPPALHPYSNPPLRSGGWLAGPERTADGAELGDGDCDGEGETHNLLGSPQ